MLISFSLLTSRSILKVIAIAPRRSVGYGKHAGLLQQTEYHP
jgi:hypothetical protein